MSENQEERINYEPLHPMNDSLSLSKLSLQLSSEQPLGVRKEGADLLWNLSNCPHTSELMFAVVSPYLLDIAKEEKDIELLQCTTGALSNLAIPAANKPAFLQHNPIPVLVPLLQSTDSLIRKHVLDIIAELGFEGEKVHDQVAHSNGFVYLVEATSSTILDVQLAAIRAIWRMSSLKDDHRRAFIKNGGIQQLLQLQKRSKNKYVNKLVQDTLNTLSESPECANTIHNLSKQKKTKSKK